MLPTTDPTTPTVTQREPVVVIVAAGVAFLNVVLVALFSFVTLEPGQTVALFAIPNALGALVAAIVARGKVAPWEPVALPFHAHDEGYDVDERDLPGGL